jgi:hypothetical protein
LLWLTFQADNGHPVNVGLTTIPSGDLPGFGQGSYSPFSSTLFMNFTTADTFLFPLYVVCKTVVVTTCDVVAHPPKTPEGPVNTPATAMTTIASVTTHTGTTQVSTTNTESTTAPATTTQPSSGNITQKVSFDLVAFIGMVAGLLVGMGMI